MSSAYSARTVSIVSRSLHRDRAMFVIILFGTLGLAVVIPFAANFLHKFFSSWRVGKSETWRTWGLG